MKKIICSILIIVLASCSSSHVCGGPGGARCVQTITKTSPGFLSTKANGILEGQNSQTQKHS